MSNATSGVDPGLCRVVSLPCGYSWKSMGIRACQQSWIIRSRCWIAHVKERAAPGRNYACAESSQLQTAPLTPRPIAPMSFRITWKTTGRALEVARIILPRERIPVGGVPGLVNTVLRASSSHSEVETASQIPVYFLIIGLWSWTAHARLVMPPLNSASAREPTRPTPP